jgi:hypothetical protein
MNHTTTMNKFPIEIVNKILMYVGELNNDVVIIQYETVSYKELYKINMLSDSLWSIQGLLYMKRLYPLMYNITSKPNKELYKWGKAHYATKHITRI